jgi:hypothetical protein
MTGPTPQQIDVAIAALRAEADLWEAQSQRLGGVVNQVWALRVDGLGRPFIFDRFLAAHDEVVLAFADRCHDGRNRTNGIGLALADIATTYEKEERANLHAQRNLY